MFRTYVIIVFILFTTTLTASPTFRVLEIHSYRPDYRWTQNIRDGLRNSLTNYNIEVSVEYLDITHSRETQFKLLDEIYSHKYKQNQFNLIVISDNNALEFMKLYRDKIFGVIPVIFCGINGYYDLNLEGLSQITGVTENVSVEGTIKALFEINTEINNVVIWSLNHKQANRNRELAVQLIQGIDNSVNIIHAKGQELYEGLEKFKTLSENDAVLLFSVLKDNDGRIISPTKTGELISSMSPAPVYVLHDIFLGSGVLGGHVVSGYHQGKTAAEYVIKLYNGEKIENLPVIDDSPNRYIFDDTVLYHMKVKKSVLPHNSITINPRPTFYEKYHMLIRGLFLLMIFLLLFIGVYLLITVKRHREREYHLINQRSALFEISNDLLCIVGRDGYFKQLNPAWEKILGWTEEELSSVQLTHFIHPDDMHLTKKSFAKVMENRTLKGLVVRYKCKDGNYLWLSWDTYPSRGNSDVFAVARDVSKDKIRTDELEHLATFDELTSINNRRSIMQILEVEIERTKRNKLTFGLLIIDIDNFKLINDSYGHLTGDKVLKEMVNICNKCLRGMDTIGRYGGEEFIVILPESDEISTLQIANRIRLSIEASIFSTNHPLTVSIGCTVYDNDNSSESIIKRADTALYDAKEHGRNKVVIT